MSKTDYPLVWYQVESRAFDTGFWVVEDKFVPEYPEETIKHKFLWWEWETEITPKYDHVTERRLAIQLAREIYERFDKKKDVRILRYENKKYINDRVDFYYLIWKNNKFYDN